MIHIEGEISIRRPVEEVFDCVVDERNEPNFNAQIVRVEKTSTGPVGPGTQFQAETKTMGGTATMTIEITAYERPYRFASSTHLSSMDIRGTLTLDPIPEGTRMRWHWEVRPRGIYRLLTPVIAHKGARREEAIWAGLKHYLEDRAA
ncbi:MAG TPA: SRPBCC family protein [Thermomicrobiaceae bacterium]|nr:SRPBCC family protein [Thermomicrobiaceae bacterium]